MYKLSFLLNPKSPEDIEFHIELLKERIYATIALLAALVSIHPTQTQPIHALFVIVGTALSLWAANIIATTMSRRIILKHNNTPKHEIRRSIAKFSPLLGAGVFPALLILLSVFGVVSLSVAIFISLIGLLLFMISISFLSARAAHAGGITTLLIAVIELVVGALIIALKFYIGH